MRGVLTAMHMHLDKHFPDQCKCYWLLSTHIFEFTSSESTGIDSRKLEKLCKLFSSVWTCAIRCQEDCLQSLSHLCNVLIYSRAYVCGGVSTMWQSLLWSDESDPGQYRALWLSPGRSLFSDPHWPLYHELAAQSATQRWNTLAMQKSLAGLSLPVCSLPVHCFCLHM